jgi:hypothetical protein
VAESTPLACPRCARRFSLEERFCPDDGMPLVYVGGGEMAPITDAHGRARKIKPQYTEGELVKVVGGRNLAEAELIQGILLEEGIPSILRRTRGFDVPDMLAAGPRDVLVPEAAAADARELLTGTDLAADAAEVEAARQPPSRFALWFLAALAAAALLVWVLYRLTV